MSRPDYLSLLGFSEGWLLWGLLSEQSLEALGRKYEAGDDKNAEHYLYRAFRHYLASHRPLQPSVAEALYRLGEEDPDPAMGRAMMTDVVGLPECPAALRERAASSGISHLVSLARRLALLAEIDHGLTSELFDRCLRLPDPTLHRALVGRPELAREQLERLAESGASKAVRNLATSRLRSKR